MRHAAAVLFAMLSTAPAPAAQFCLNVVHWLSGVLAQ